MKTIHLLLYFLAGLLSLPLAAQIGTISDGESGSSVRGKLNTVIGEVNALSASALQGLGASVNSTENEVSVAILDQSGGLLTPFMIPLSTDSFAGIITGPEHTLLNNATQPGDWDTTSEINAATTDDDFVTLTGSQIITGQKIFTAPLLVGDVDVSAQLVLADGAGNGVEIVPQVEDGDVILTLPAGGGTLALTSDINTDTLTGTLPNYRVGKQTIDTALAPQFTTGAFTSLSPTIARVSVTGAWPIAAGMVEDMHSDLYNAADEFTWVVEFNVNPHVDDVLIIDDFDNVGATTTATVTTEQVHGLEVGDTVFVENTGAEVSGNFTVVTQDGAKELTINSGYGVDITDDTGTFNPVHDYTLFSVGNFWDGNEVGYSLVLTQDGGLRVKHYGPTTESTLTEAGYFSPGDSGVVILRKSGTTLELLSEGLIVLDTATVDAEIENITTSSGSATRMLTILGGQYDESQADAMPQHMMRGTLVETYAWPRALTDSELRAGLREHQARNSYTFELTKDPRNPIYDSEVLLAASDNLLRNWLYSVPLKISENNYLLFFGASQHPAESPSNQGIGVAISNDADKWSFPILGLEEVDTGDGFNNFLVESKDNFQDIIEDPSDTSRWLALAEGRFGDSSSDLITIPKDFSEGGTKQVELTSATEVKTIWDWKDTGRIAHMVKSTALALDGTGVPWTTRTMVLSITDSADYTGAKSSFGPVPEWTAWPFEQDFYGAKVKKWGDVLVGTASIFNKATQRIEGFGLYLSEDGTIWEQVRPWALKSSENSSDFDYGQLLASTFVEKTNGDLLFTYTGFNALHNASELIAKLGYATLPRAALDRAVANMLDHATLTNRDERCYFGGTGQYVTLSGDIILSGEFDIEFSYMTTDNGDLQSLFGHTTGDAAIEMQNNGASLRFYWDDAGNSFFATMTFDAALLEETRYTIRLRRDATDEIYCYINGVQQTTTRNNNRTLTLNLIGNGSGTQGLGGKPLQGMLSDITIDIGDNGTVDHTFIGNRNDAAGWADQTGSLTATPTGLFLLTYLLGNQDGGIVAP